MWNKWAPFPLLAEENTNHHYVYFLMLSALRGIKKRLISLALANRVHTCAPFSHSFSFLFSSAIWTCMRVVVVDRCFPSCRYCLPPVLYYSPVSQGSDGCRVTTPDIRSAHLRQRPWKQSALIHFWSKNKWFVWSFDVLKFLFFEVRLVKSSASKTLYAQTKQAADTTKRSAALKANSDFKPPAISL